MVTDPQPSFWTEVLKYSIGPVITLIGVFIGSHLNAKLTRKQKLRDELFSYKVKAYASFASVLVEVENDYLNGLSIHENSETAPFDDDEYLGPLKISTFYYKKYKENFLFFDNDVKHHAEDLGIQLYRSSQLHLMAANTNDIANYILIENNERIREACQNLGKILYIKIDLNKI